MGHVRRKVLPSASGCCFWLLLLLLLESVVAVPPLLLPPQLLLLLLLVASALVGVASNSLSWGLQTWLPTSRQRLGQLIQCAGVL